MILRYCVTTLAFLNVASMAFAQPPAKVAEVEKAEAQFREGKSDDAFHSLQDAVKKHPQLPPATLLMARLHFSAGQTGPGRARLEQAAAEAPNHPEVYLTNASQALAEGRMLDTILNCQTAIVMASADRWTADQKKRFQREAHAGLAAAFEARQDWEAARTQLLAMLELEPKNGATRQRLARAQLLLGHETEAFNELQQASKDDAAVEPAEAMMGHLLSQRGNVKQAEDWLQKAVQKYPQDARVHRAYGGWLLDRGRIETAKIHIDIAAEREPKSRSSMMLKGVLARSMKDYETAVKIFEELVREQPGDFYASNQLTLACIELPEKRQRAIQQAELNARLYPRFSEALATLGWAYFQAGRIDEAEKALSMSASNGQISSDTAFYLAKLLKEKGKAADAKEILKKALDSDGPFINRAAAKLFWDELSSSK